MSDHGDVAINNNKPSAKPDGLAKITQVPETKCLKIVVLGGRLSGKTSLIRRFCFCDEKDPPKDDEPTVPTLGVDYYSKKIHVKRNPIQQEQSEHDSEEQEIHVQLWDTPGELPQPPTETTPEKGAWIPSFLSSASIDGIILTFDATSLKSFQQSQQWHKLFVKAGRRIPIILVANHTDQLYEQLSQPFEMQSFPQRSILVPRKSKRRTAAWTLCTPPLDKYPGPCMKPVTMDDVRQKAGEAGVKWMNEHLDLAKKNDFSHVSHGGVYPKSDVAYNTINVPTKADSPYCWRDNTLYRTPPHQQWPLDDPMHHPYVLSSKVDFYGVRPPSVSSTQPTEASETNTLASDWSHHFWDVLLSHLCCYKEISNDQSNMSYQGIWELAQEEEDEIPDRQSILEWCESVGAVPIFETSAKFGTGVHRAVDSIILRILDDREDEATDKAVFKDQGFNSRARLYSISPLNDNMRYWYRPSPTFRSQSYAHTSHGYDELVRTSSMGSTSKRAKAWVHPVVYVYKPINEVDKQFKKHNHYAYHSRKRPFILSERYQSPPVASRGSSILAMSSGAADSSQCCAAELCTIDLCPIHVSSIDVCSFNICSFAPPCCCIVL